MLKIGLIKNAPTNLLMIAPSHARYYGIGETTGISPEEYALYRTVSESLGATKPQEVTGADLGLVGDSLATNTYFLFFA